MCDVFPKEIRPSNVKFQVANMLEGLPFPDNTFDFVHMRLLLIGVKKDEWPELFKEVFRVLKPGGCAQSVEAGMLVSQEKKKLLFPFQISTLFFFCNTARWR